MEWLCSWQTFVSELKSVPSGQRTVLHVEAFRQVRRAPSIPLSGQSVLVHVLDSVHVHRTALMPSSSHFVWPFSQVSPGASTHEKLPLFSTHFPVHGRAVQLLLTQDSSASPLHRFAPFVHVPGGAAHEKLPLSSTHFPVHGRAVQILLTQDSSASPLHRLAPLVHITVGSTHAKIPLSSTHFPVHGRAVQLL